MPFGAAAAGHQRIATLKSGIPQGVVCATGPTGATQPFFAAISTSTHDRINSSTAGIRAGFVCTIFVRTREGGATAYRMNTRNSTDIGVMEVPAGLTLVEDTTRGDYVEALAWEAFQAVSAQP